MSNNKHKRNTTMEKNKKKPTNKQNKTLSFTNIFKIKIYKIKIMKKNRRKIVISRYGRKNKGKQHTERKRKTFYLGTILFYCSQMK